METTTGTTETTGTTTVVLPLVLEGSLTSTVAVPPATVMVVEQIGAVMAPKRKYQHSAQFMQKKAMQHATELVAEAKASTDAPRFLNARKIGVKALDVGSLDLSDLTDRERRVFDAVIGSDPESLKARSLTEIGTKSFPKHPTQTARIMACIVLRKLAVGGLIARVRRGWYLPQKRALATVLAEK